MSAWIESLLQQVTAVTPVGLFIVAIAGLIVGIAPSSFPLLSVAAGFAGRSQVDTGRTGNDGLWLSLAFALGIVTVDAVVGALFGFVGFAAMRVLIRFLAPTYLLLAILLAVMALALLRVVKIRIPVLTPSPRPTLNIVGAYALGLPFGLSTCPACTPLLPDRNDGNRERRPIDRRGLDGCVWIFPNGADRGCWSRGRRAQSHLARLGACPLVRTGWRSSAAHHKHICSECAEVCDECAASCEQLEDMQACVVACRRCAERCRAIAA